MSNVPLTADDSRDAQLVVITVYYINCREVRSYLKDIVFKKENNDIQTRVYRWDIILLMT